MRVLLLVATTAALCVNVPAAFAQEQLQLYAVVVNGATGEPVESLSPDEVRVQEDGQEMTILGIEPITWPVKLELLIDNGIGIDAAAIPILKDGLTGFINALPEDVEVTMVTTAPQPRRLVRESTSRDELLEGLTRIAPDRGAGNFVESMSEATERIDDDDSEFFPVIMAFGTTAGDGNVRERDINRIYERLGRKPIVVHVIILAGTTGTLTGGDAQTRLGIDVTNGSGGRYENINLPNILPELLPEFGRLIADSHRLAKQQYLLTLERPDGKSGDLGQISAGAGAGKVIKSLSMDGRIRTN